MVTAVFFPHKSSLNFPFRTVNSECYKSREREKSTSQSSPVVEKTPRDILIPVKRKSEFFFCLQSEREKKRDPIIYSLFTLCEINWRSFRYKTHASHSERYEQQCQRSR